MREAEAVSASLTHLLQGGRGGGGERETERERNGEKETETEGDGEGERETKRNVWRVLAALQGALRLGKSFVSVHTRPDLLSRKASLPGPASPETPPSPGQPTPADRVMWGCWPPQLDTGQVPASWPRLGQARVPIQRQSLSTRSSLLLLLSLA